MRFPKTGQFFKCQFIALLKMKWAIFSISGNLFIHNSRNFFYNSSKIMPRLTKWRIFGWCNRLAGW